MDAVSSGRVNANSTAAFHHLNHSTDRYSDLSIAAEYWCCSSFDCFPFTAPMVADPTQGDPMERGDLQVDGVLTVGACERLTDRCCALAWVCDYLA